MQESEDLNRWIRQQLAAGRTPEDITGELRKMGYDATLKKVQPEINLPTLQGSSTGLASGLLEETWGKKEKTEKDKDEAEAYYAYAERLRKESSRLEESRKGIESRAATLKSSAAELEKEAAELEKKKAELEEKAMYLEEWRRSIEERAPRGAISPGEIEKFNLEVQRLNKEIQEFEKRRTAFEEKRAQYLTAAEQLSMEIQEFETRRTELLREIELFEATPPPAVRLSPAESAYAIGAPLPGLAQHIGSVFGVMQNADLERARAFRRFEEEAGKILPGYAGATRLEKWGLELQESGMKRILEGGILDKIRGLAEVPVGWTAYMGGGIAKAAILTSPSTLPLVSAAEAKAGTPGVGRFAQVFYPAELAAEALTAYGIGRGAELGAKAAGRLMSKTLQRFEISLPRLGVSEALERVRGEINIVGLVDSTNVRFSTALKEFDDAVIRAEGLPILSGKTGRGGFTLASYSGKETVMGVPVTKTPAGVIAPATRGRLGEGMLTGGLAVAEREVIPAPLRLQALELGYAGRMGAAAERRTVERVSEIYRDMLKGYVDIWRKSVYESGVRLSRVPALGFETGLGKGVVRLREFSPEELIPGGAYIVTGRRWFTRYRGVARPVEIDERQYYVLYGRAKGLFGEKEFAKVLTPAKVAPYVEKPSLGAKLYTTPVPELPDYEKLLYTFFRKGVKEEGVKKIPPPRSRTPLLPKTPESPGIEKFPRIEPSASLSSSTSTKTVRPRAARQQQLMVRGARAWDEDEVLLVPKSFFEIPTARPRLPFGAMPVPVVIMRQRFVAPSKGIVAPSAGVFGKIKLPVFPKVKFPTIARVAPIPAVKQSVKVTPVPIEVPRVDARIGTAEISIPEVEGLLGVKGIGRLKPAMMLPQPKAGAVKGGIPSSPFNPRAGGDGKWGLWLKQRFIDEKKLIESLMKAGLGGGGGGVKSAKRKRKR